MQLMADHMTKMHRLLIIHHDSLAEIERTQYGKWKEECIKVVNNFNENELGIWGKLIQGFLHQAQAPVTGIFIKAKYKQISQTCREISKLLASGMDDLNKLKLTFCRSGAGECQPSLSLPETYIQQLSWEIDQLSTLGKKRIVKDWSSVCNSFKEALDKFTEHLKLAHHSRLERITKVCDHKLQEKHKVIESRHDRLLENIAAEVAKMNVDTCVTLKSTVIRSEISNELNFKVKKEGENLNMSNGIDTRSTSVSSRTDEFSCHDWSAGISLTESVLAEIDSISKDALLNKYFTSLHYRPEFSKTRLPFTSLSEDTWRDLDGISLDSYSGDYVRNKNDNAGTESKNTEEDNKTNLSKFKSEHSKESGHSSGPDENSASHKSGSGSLTESYSGSQSNSASTRSGEDKSSKLLKVIENSFEGEESSETSLKLPSQAPNAIPNNRTQEDGRTGLFKKLCNSCSMDNFIEYFCPCMRSWYKEYKERRVEVREQNMMQNNALLRSKSRS